MDRRRLPRLDLPHAGRGPAEVVVDRDGRATFREGAVDAAAVAARTERALWFDGCEVRGAAVPPTCRELVVVECRAALLDIAGANLHEVTIRRSVVDDSRLSGIAGHVRLEDTRLVRCR